MAGWVFGTLGIERLNLLTMPGNAPSQRVAERAGFSREGLLRAWVPTADGRRDSVMYSLLPGDPRAPGLCGQQVRFTVWLLGGRG